MNFNFTASQTKWRDRVAGFMAENIYPAEDRYETEAAGGERWKTLALVEDLKQRARAAGLWNLFMPPRFEPPVSDFKFEGPGLSNLEYALVAEQMGKVYWAPEIFNCSAPDAGNMEVLLRYGSLEQQEAWLRPLMDGAIRSAFLMTEPDVASSDATNIETRIERDGGHYTINGRKWWSSGAGDPRCKINIVMGKTRFDGPTYSQQTMILVPQDAAGIEIVRMLTVFGYDDAPHGHGEVILRNVRVPRSNILLGEGRGFEIAQGRLGPGRIHHCMRVIGVAERALQLMCTRLIGRVAFGKPLSEQSVWEQRVADARIDIEMTRLLCLKAADRIDREGAKAARSEIAMIKVAAPRMACRILDHAIQAHGGGGLSQAFVLAKLYALTRVLRISDGPDEVHQRAIGRREFGRYARTT